MTAEQLIAHRLLGWNEHRIYPWVQQRQGIVRCVRCAAEQVGGNTEFATLHGACVSELRRRRGGQLQVFTAKMRYDGPNRLDITGQAVNQFGNAFAPAAGILAVPPAGYVHEMRLSYRDRQEAWDEVLRWVFVVLVCYCPDPSLCHRTMLATILGKLGAHVWGELDGRAVPIEVAA